MYPLLWVVLLVPTIVFANDRVRHIECQPDQIITVRTAIGIASIIQVPDRPSSVVVGDQEKFRVEYLDQAITIKPLQAGAKSNLYIYTDYRRFNVQLITGPESTADYVVYLENIKLKEPKSNSIKWKPYVRSMQNGELTLETKRLARTHDGNIFIEFQITSLKMAQFNPEWIWVTQVKRARPIQNLFVSSVSLNTGEKAQGTIQLLLKDLDPTKPMRIELRKQKTSFLILPEVNSWK